MERDRKAVSKWVAGSKIAVAVASALKTLYDILKLFT